MKKKTIFALVAIIMLGYIILMAKVALADDAAPVQHLLISAVQTGSKASASEEYVKIYNPNSSDVDVTGWKLQYRSAGSTGSWATKSSFACADSASACQAVVPAKSEVILAPSAYNLPGKNYLMTDGLASTGGQLQLVGMGGTEDMVGYGNAAVSESNQPAPTPAAGDAIVRKTDVSTNDFVDTDNNANDFVLLSSLKTDMVTESSASAQKPGTPAVDYPKILITELLPDPASPATDSNDEFVELYNPNSTAVDLKGYVLQSGTNWRYKFTMPELTLNAGSYIALYSAQTKVTLSNSGTEVRLLDPNGNVADQISSYGSANTGQAWMVDSDGAWQWTTTPTPSGANNLAAAPSVVKVKTSSTTSASSSKAAAAKKTATATTKPKSTTSKSAPSSPATNPAASAAAQGASTGSSANYWLIGSSVGLAGGYGVYEYRTDIMNVIRRLRDRFVRRQ